MLSVLSQAFALDKTSADYYVDHLPGAPDGPLPKMHAGYDFYNSRNSKTIANTSIGMLKLMQNTTGICFFGILRIDISRTGNER